jgi:hypothetical protein
LADPTPVERSVEGLNPRQEPKQICDALSGLFVARVKPLESAHARLLAALSAEHHRGIASTTLDDISTADPRIGSATALLAADLIGWGLIVAVHEEPRLAVTLTAAGKRSRPG